MRISLMAAGGGGVTVRDIAELAAAAQDRGFDGLYLPEAWRSGFVALTAAAAATGADRGSIALGPYVVNAHAHSPLFTGIAAVDLDEFSGGRLVLGIGSGNRVTNEQYQGIPVRRPLAKMRDYLRVLTAVTRARAGERVDVAGSVHSTIGWHSQVSPVRPALPIVLAATSPKMTELAMTEADGVALGSLLSVASIAEVAGRAGRAASAVRPLVMASAFVAVDDDEDLARAAARAAVVNLYAGKPHPHYDSLLRQQGFGDVADAVGSAVAAGDIAGARSAVSDAVIDTLTIAGTAEGCRARIAQYAPYADELILVDVAQMHFQSSVPGERVPTRPAGPCAAVLGLRERGE